MHPQKSTDQLVIENHVVPSSSPRTWSIPVLKIAIITNHPPPFRIPVYEIISSMPGIDLQVIFCSRREPNRQWKLQPLNFKHVFLRERFLSQRDNYIHNNLDVIAALHSFSPDVVITTGFNPTYLYACAYAVLKRVIHIPMTDGTDTSEKALSKWHKLLRRLVFSRSQAFISASSGGQRLYESYGIPAESCFHSCLCIANEAYLQDQPHEEKKFDFIFCGRIVEMKNPLFALDVAQAVARRLGRKTSILFVGSGRQEELVKKKAALLNDLVDTTFNGFAAQQELPALYRSARIFLFPTLSDAWGVVANEAAAAGLPILTSPHAGVANELVVHEDNGFVCEPDVDLWSEHAILLLTQPAVYQRFSTRSRAIVSNYTFEQAAQGVVSACRYALAKEKAKKKFSLFRKQLEV